MCANYVFDTPDQIRIGLLLIFLNGHGGEYPHLNCIQKVWQTTDQRPYF